MAQNFVGLLFTSNFKLRIENLCNRNVCYSRTDSVPPIQ